MRNVYDDKSEIRNPKFETGIGKGKDIFRFLNSDIISDSEICVSDLLLGGEIVSDLGR